MMIGCACLQQIIGLVAPSLGNLVGSALAFYMIWAARPGYLAALMINQLTAGNFTILGHEGSATAVNLVTYALSFAILVRVSWELIANPRTFRRWRWLLGAWYVGIALAVIMALLGRAAGNPSWTLPVRFAWTAGALFYGVILARRWPADGRVLWGGVFQVIVGLLVLFSLGLLHHKLKFILVPLAFPMAWLAWHRARRLNRVLAVGAIMMAAMLGLGAGVVGVESESTENYGVGGATLSLNALFVGSVALTLTIAMGSRLIRTTCRVVLGWPAFLFVVIFSFTIAAVGPKYRIDRWVDADEVMTIKDNIKLKMFDDRSRIWSTALYDITKGSYIIKASGQSLWIDHPLLGEREWPFGAHNSVMNTILVQRWLGGAIVLTMVGVAMSRASASLSMGRFNAIHVLGIFTAVTGTVGLVVNDYPTNDEAGFWFFGFAGIVAGVLEARAREKAGKSPVCVAHNASGHRR